MPRLATVVLVVALTAGQIHAFECVDYTDVLQQQAELAIAQEYPTDLHVAGNVAYSIAEGSPFVAVYDLSDPDQPLELAPLILPAVPSGFAASNDWLLVTVPDLGLVRYDLADPLAPVAYDTLDLGVALPAVAIDGDLAVVSTVSGVRVIGLDFPSGMLGLGVYATASAVNAVAVAGNRLYLATSTSGLLVLDAADPTWLQPVGEAYFPRAAERVTVRHDLAVLVGRGPGVTGFTAMVYDVSGDVPPQPMATFEENDGFYYGAVPVITNPERVVIAARGAGLYEYRVGDRSVQPMGFYPGKHAEYHEEGARYVLISESSLSVGLPGPFPPAPVWVDGAGRASAVRGDLIYSVHYEKFRIVDTGDPAAATVIGSLDLPNINDDRRSLAVHGPAVYIGRGYFRRFEIVDVTDPTYPVLIDEIQIPAEATGLVADAGVLYLLMAGWGIATYDLADPFAPQHIVTMGLDIGQYRGAVKLGDQLLVGTESSGVDVYDVSDPSAVLLVDNLPGRQHVSDLALAGDRLLVTDRVNPVQVWEHESGTGDWTLLGEVPASRILRAATSGSVGYLLHEFGDVVMLDLVPTGVPPIVGTAPTSFAADAGLLAGENWVSVRWGPFHRFYPPPCLSVPTTVHEAPPAVSPLVLAAAPNPFNPRTRLRYELPTPGHARLQIFDLRGRLVRTLVDEPRPAGPGVVDWSGADEAGRPVPSGIYHARLTAAGATVSYKMSLLK